MKNRVTTRERGIIRGCRKRGPDSHMAVDGLGRPWIEVAKLPSTIDAWLAALHEETRQSRIRRGRDPETRELIEAAAKLRCDLTAEQWGGSAADRANWIRLSRREAESSVGGSPSGLAAAGHYPYWSGRNDVWAKRPRAAKAVIAMAAQPSGPAGLAGNGGASRRA